MHRFTSIFSNHGDFNGDNKPDLAVANSSSHTIRHIDKSSIFEPAPTDISLF